MASLAFNPRNIQGHGLVYTTLLRIKDPKNLYLLEEIKPKHIKVDDFVKQETHRLENVEKWHCL